MAVDSVINEAFAALDTALIDGGLGVAVSGGGDSMALLHLAAEWAQKRVARVEVATVDHGLRAESRSEAQMVEAAASALGLKVETLRWIDQPQRGNLQAEARGARRRLLADWAARRGLGAVALGHTMDDQAETVLMRLVRGSGVDGLSGMAERMTADGVVWLRPLLSRRRAELREWLQTRGVGWVDDPSNEDDRFDRVRTRRALSALAPLGIDAPGLAATATRLRTARDALEHGVEALAAEAAQWGALGEVRLRLAPLRAAPDELSRRMIRAALTRVSGAEHGPRAEAEARLLTAMLGLQLGGGRSLHGCIVRPDGPDRVVIAREVSAVVFAPAPPPQNHETTWDGRFALQSSRLERGAQVGPLGACGAARLRALEAAGDWRAPASWARSPEAARLATPALWRDDALEAAPFARYGTGLRARLIFAA